MKTIPGYKILNGLKPHHLMPLILLGLVMGIVGGWIRLGYIALPVASAAMSHGLLMVGGFLGTLICLERCMVMKAKGWLLLPLLGLVATGCYLLGFETYGMYALTLQSIGLFIVLYLQTVKYKLTELVIMCVGAVCWIIGNVLVIKTGFVPVGTTWWIGFILMTIVGERLEFGKFLPNPRWSKACLYTLLTVFFVGLLIPFHEGGSWLMGMCALFIGLWLLRFDMARIAVRKVGYHRYIGLGLIIGYVWLVIFGLVLCLMDSHPYFYDLFLHTFFLGFAFSMIWAHAPIILPTVFKRSQTAFHPVLWPFWTLFQISLTGRMLFSLLKYTNGRSWFGIFNGWMVLAMFALMVGILVYQAVTERKQRVSSIKYQEPSIGKQVSGTKYQETSI